MHQNGPRQRPNRKRRNKVPLTAFTFDPTVNEFQNQQSAHDYLNFKFKPVKQQTRSVPKIGQRVISTHFTLNPYFHFALELPGDYRKYHQNPSHPINWDQVGKVLRMVDEDIQCSICLDTQFKFPRVTGCGHCFCWPCLIRFFNAQSTGARKCPVCSEELKMQALRPVEIIRVPRVVEGQAVGLHLFRREKGAVTIERCGEEATGYRYNGFYDIRGNQAQYNRILLHIDKWSDNEHIIAELEGIDRSQLDTSEEISYDSVLRYLRKLKSSQKLQNPVESKSLFRAPCSCNKLTNQISQNCESCNLPDRPSEQIDIFDIPVHPEPDRDGEHFLYFYALPDGQPYFLHPLLIQMLAKHHGGYHLLPPTITSRIIQIEDVIVSEAEQRRNKFLQHLPEGVCAYFIEVEIKKLVSQDIWNRYSKELNQRQQQRRRARIRENITHQHIERRKREEEIASEQLVSYFVSPSYATPVQKPKPPTPPPEEEAEAEEETKTGAWGASKDIMYRPSRPIARPSFPQLQSKAPEPPKDPAMAQIVAEDESLMEFVPKQRRLCDFFKQVFRQFLYKI